MQSVEIHVNGAFSTDPPIQFADEPAFPVALCERRIRHPWCDTRVTINKLSHPRKGQSGTIVDVLLNQSTSTGLVIVLRLEQFEPVAPFPIISIHCDYVVETTYVLVIDKYIQI